MGPVLLAAEVRTCEWTLPRGGLAEAPGWGSSCRVDASPSLAPSSLPWGSCREGGRDLLQHPGAISFIPLIAPVTPSGSPGRLLPPGESVGPPRPGALAEVAFVLCSQGSVTELGSSHSPPPSVCRRRAARRPEVRYRRPPNRHPGANLTH